MIVTIGKNSPRKETRWLLDSQFAALDSRHLQSQSEKGSLTDCLVGCEAVANPARASA